ncbi:unnamed protein product [Amaranthus hypochondriacus]
MDQVRSRLLNRAYLPALFTSFSLIWLRIFHYSNYSIYERITLFHTLPHRTTLEGLRLGWILISLSSPLKQAKP